MEASRGCHLPPDGGHSFPDSVFLSMFKIVIANQEEFIDIPEPEPNVLCITGHGFHPDYLLLPPAKEQICIAEDEAGFRFPVLDDFNISAEESNHSEPTTS
ncbi:hypothetical protein NDU88_006792 [Pleurodeles waltl]|uniref:Uncharacterized protein n=1 Tax=Pleurodeles waltl TaxID=8319 RepID=A0AAV7N099_PLEWA|nr:hypothetical protein NDU88_006792 [Pleurodeles waltl]